MICTKCNNEMTQVVKHGLTIDTCSMCGGIWLDKGKLGELMARTMQAQSSLDQELSGVQPPRQEYGRPSYHEGDQRSRDHQDDHDHRDKNKHKKRSLWDIFD
jgi:Zn-finger nucleic acid-binding protein